MTTIKTGIVGAAGYTGGELIRLLINHPNVAIQWIHSNSQNGKPLEAVHPDLIGDADLVFTDQIATDGLDLVFLCLPHGEARPFLKAHHFGSKTVIIDLSTDFRDESEGFVYGLPEVNAARIKKAMKIANPGCFATGIQLALAPAVKKGWCTESLHVNGITGSTGAGKKLSTTTHFSQRNQNASVYKLFSHQHLKEINQTFGQLDPTFKGPILFVPNRGNFCRGIWVTAYFPFSGSLEEARKVYLDFYKEAAFTHVSHEDIDLKQVVNTNKCIVHLKKEAGQLAIYSITDNLLKGASGQAVQNMNLAFGLDEKTGLRLKSSAF
ncbi:N-acetyl-gamma-glutamyl-phosphate reductase [Cyclobacterium jeungdonense]|uniref:N-acetyl-gamma-glutamyl-phosphate reductase n=1 Tax=Cyclobacterium jeungdonense TaxID=708087 RepID=A0ABT8CDX5_9BACT|nr:N-acetyl-gamma-glutamyl-phosphate reductase [Cyclobacterium jeungdonense]MDN3689925.1 N-acetyl-gamma-glutamyl-phosphate reductase [Cyclobacterium jeungdonense]